METITLKMLKEEIKMEIKEEIMIELIKKLLYGENKEDNLDNSKQYKEELNKLKKQKENLKKELEDIQQKKSQQDQEINMLKQTNKELQSRIENEKEKNLKLNEKIIQLEKSQVKELKEFEELYSKLSETTKMGLQNVLKNKNQLSLFCSGIKNIGDVWDYAVYLDTEHKDEDFKVIREMFYLLFEVYKNIENVNLDDVDENDEFDSDLYLKNSRSEEYSGKIKKVLLKGYKKGDKIIKQSLVEL